ncbi:nitroreductase family protein [Virgibacillus oceani]|uniref:NADH oxidoreductase n=1 Tax=Virgibacillus oceani TaxID=1479511 RepID=A0A917H9H0_9BACI|nr:nitroreductase family protein [Virgibacillus oceani]GGG71377.1 NADH oxidoreductase [Virgibacillus oceani]
MNVFEAIQERREITKYLDKSIPDEALRKVEDAGIFAPTGNNLPSKDLIIVKNRKVLDKLAETTPYMKWQYEAPAAIVVTGRPDVSKYWLQDASIACAFIWLEAVEAGLGSAFGAVYHSQDEQESLQRENHVKSLLGIPDDRRIVAVLGLGYPKENPKPKKHIPRDEMVHYERFV